MTEVSGKLWRLFLVLALIVGISSLPSFAWWNTSWSQIRQITVVSTGSLNNTQLYLNVTFDTDMQADFDDIRFVGANDTTVLSYGLVSKVDSLWAEFIVKLNITSGTDIPANMYYGNPSATSLGNLLALDYCDFETSICNWTKTNGVETLIQDSGTKYAGSYSLHLDTDTTGTPRGGYRIHSTTFSNTKISFYQRREEVDYMQENVLANSTCYSTTGCIIDLRTNNGGKYTWASWAGDLGAYSTSSFDKVEIVRLLNGTAWLWVNNVLKYTASGINSALTVDRSIIVDGNNNNVGIWLDNFHVRNIIYPEPNYSFGSEEKLSGYPLQIQMSGNQRPDVQLNFSLVQTGGLFNKSWWNFSDGNSSYYVAGNSTSHFYSEEGFYNVSVIATNASSVNLTAYYELTLTETTSTFSLRNTMTNTFLQNWTLMLWNATHSLNYSVLNNQTVNYTDLRGTIYVYPLKSEYNTTLSNFTVNPESNSNIVLNASPSIIEVNVWDYLFSETSLPFKITYTNESKSVTHSYSGWISSFYNSITGTNVGILNWSNTSQPSQIFKYNFSAYDPYGDLHDENATFILKDINGNNPKILEYFGEFYPSPTPISRWVFLDKDGTYTVRDISGTIILTGTFPFFPAVIYGSVVATDTVHANEKTVTLGVSTIPTWYDVVYLAEIKGNVTVVISQDTSGSYGYLDNLYRPLRFFVQNDGFMIHNLTAYLIGTANSYSVRFSVYDASNSVVPSSIVKIYRLVNETYGEFGSALTDETGSTPYFWVDEDESLWVIATRGSDSTGLHNVVVSQTTYEVRLQFELENQLLPAFFEGVSLSFSPAGSTVYDNSSTNFSMYLTDPDSLIINATAVLNSSNYGFDYDFSSTDDSMALFSQELNLTELSGLAGDINFYYEIYRQNIMGEIERLSGLNDWDVISSSNLMTELSGIEFSGFKGLFAIVILAGAVATSVWMAIFAGVILGLLNFITWDIVLIVVILAVMARMREANE